MMKSRTEAVHVYHLTMTISLFFFLAAALNHWVNQQNIDCNIIHFDELEGGVAGRQVTADMIKMRLLSRPVVRTSKCLAPPATPPSTIRPKLNRLDRKKEKEGEKKKPKQLRRTEIPPLFGDFFFVCGVFPPLFLFIFLLLRPLFLRFLCFSIFLLPLK